MSWLTSCCHLLKMCMGTSHLFSTRFISCSKTKPTQSWSRDNFPDFSATRDPQSSPDLNPLDYIICWYVMARLNNHKRINLTNIKVLLKYIGTGLDFLDESTQKWTIYANIVACDEKWILYDNSKRSVQWLYIHY